MDYDPAGQGPTNEILRKVHGGMDIIDRSGKKLGSVAMVYLGNNPMTGPATPSSTAVEPGTQNVVVPVTGSDTLSMDQNMRGAGVLTTNFFSNDMPEELRHRLQMDGFIRMNTKGLFARDRFVLPDQVESVEGDRVMLNVGIDELTKA